jgi:signal transduction histidine kinase
MSAALHEQERALGRHGKAPVSARVFAWIVVVGTMPLIALGVASGPEPGLAPFAFCSWLVLVAIADFHAVSLRNWTQFSISLPLLLAASMTTSPALAGLVAFLGYVDRREFRGQVELPRAAFNRCQIALSVMAGSYVFHSAGGDVTEWPSVLVPAALCIAADCLVNMVCVTGTQALIHRRTLGDVFLTLFPEQGFLEFAGTYLCLGLMGLTMAVAFEMGSVWGLVVSFAPLFFAAKMLERNQRLAEVTEDLRRKDRGLVAATRRMETERRDERGVLAGSLHDDVLPPLFQVQLMADVVRRDLASGALMDLETDLPAMLEAAEATSDAIRGLIGDLRKSSLGPGGLIPTLRLRIRDIESRSTSLVQVRIDRVPSDSLVELVAYQVAREAIENAATHGKASSIVLTIAGENSGFRLEVADDGLGFDPSLGSPDGHFGLTMMRERVRAIGGELKVQSEVGKGSAVSAWLPAKVRPTE